jgi:hypothetical protein
MRPLASTPSNICNERVFSQVATFLPFLLVFQGFLPLLAHSLRIPWALPPTRFPRNLSCSSQNTSDIRCAAEFFLIFSWCCLTHTQPPTPEADPLSRCSYPQVDALSIMFRSWFIDFAVILPAS